MPVLVSPRARELYTRSLREIENALTDIGEALREDAEMDARAAKVILEELSDAADRIADRIAQLDGKARRAVRFTEVERNE